MQVDHNTISFEIEYGNAEEHWDCRRLEVVQIIREFRMLAMILETITNDDEQSKDQENV